MRISDWSSDVCSSDLCDADARPPRCRRCSCEIRANIAPARSIRKANSMKFFASCNKGLEYLLADELLALGCARAPATMAGVNVDRTCGVSGKRVAVRVGHGGRRLITQK